MREYDEDERKYSWIVHAVGALLVGGLAGYIIAIAGTRPGAGALTQAAAAAPAASAVALVDEGALRAYRDILARDPNNLAVAAWEQLLQSSPSFPNAAAVRDLLADARLKSSVVRQ